MTERYTFWTPARVYAAYRVVLAILLGVVFHLAPTSLITDNGQPALFITIAVIYLLITLLSAALMSPLRRRFPNWSSLLPILADILLLTLLIHASGGTKSTLSVDRKSVV